MTLSGNLKILCLGESLNIYATSRFIFENELYFPKGRQSLSKLQCMESLKGTLNPHSDRRPHYPGNISQKLTYLN